MSYESFVFHNKKMWNWLSLEIESPTWNTHRSKLIWVFLLLQYLLFCLNLTIEMKYRFKKHLQMGKTEPTKLNLTPLTILCQLFCIETWRHSNSTFIYFSKQNSGGAIRMPLSCWYFVHFIHILCINSKMNKFPHQNLKFSTSTINMNSKA